MKILIKVPDGLVKEVDALAALEYRNRSELVREALRMYVEQRRLKLQAYSEEGRNGNHNAEGV